MQNRRVLCSEEAVQQIGNIFDSVLVMAHRLRELKSGAEALTQQEPTMMGTVYREAEEGYLTKSRLLASR